MLFRAKPEVLFQQVDDEGVLLSLEEEVYFGVNESAARVWQQLQEGPCSEDALVAHMAAVYPDAPRAVIAADVAELLAELDRNGLLLHVAASAGIRLLAVPGALTRAG